MHGKRDGVDVRVDKHVGRAPGDWVDKAVLDMQRRHQSSRILAHLVRLVLFDRRNKCSLQPSRYAGYLPITVDLFTFKTYRESCYQ